MATRSAHAPRPSLGAPDRRRAERAVVGVELGLFARVAFHQGVTRQAAFASHHIEDIDGIALASIEDPTRRFNDLAIAPAAQFIRLRSAVRMRDQLFDVLEYALNQFPCRGRVVQCNVIGDGVEVVESGLGPDYFSHRAMRFLALAWVSTRPSSTAFSPRAMPSSSVRSFCWRS